MNPFNSPMTRRSLGCFAAGLVTAGLVRPCRTKAAGLSVAAGNVVLAAPIPCAQKPGDIVGLVLEGYGSADGAVVVFGQAFRQGAVAKGAAIAARQTNGRSLPVQLDVITRHPDGSVRFGVVSLSAPALRAGERIGVVLAAGSSIARAIPLDLAAMIADRQVVVELAPLSGGEAWSADLLSLLRARQGDGSASVWQSGPLAFQAQISVPVPPAAIGGVSSMRLVADISVHADETLWADVWLRNDIAMRPGGGAAAYRVRVLLDGRTAITAEVGEHEQYAAWGRLLGTPPRGRPVRHPPFVRFDTAYLADTGAVAHYDQSIGVDEAILIRLAHAVRSPGWDVPLGIRELTPYMPTTGGRDDIGPTTMAQAVWLLTGDPRAADYAIGQAEAAGGVPWHVWDPTGGADGTGGWMDTKHWPRFSVDDRNGPPPRSLLQPPSRKVWAPDIAHQPDLSYVPFLLTGRRTFLDGLQAQAAWNVLAVWLAMRTANEMVIVQETQIRGAAWGLRQIDEAAWISPDADANTTYLRDVADQNWRWLTARTARWTVAQGEAHGWLDPGKYEAYSGGIAPWQQDFLASSVIASAGRGNQNAVSFLNWQANYLVGRFLSDSRGFNYRDGAAYALAVVDPNGQFYKTWAEIGAAQQARGESNRDGWSKGTPYFALATLAGIASLGGPHANDARRAYARLLETGGASIQPANLARFPTWNIAPRGMPRIPAHAPRCTTRAL